MKRTHVKKYFLNWLERKLSPTEENRVEVHLETCAECREYFDKMQLFLGEPELTAIPELQPDTFLPTQIKEKAKRSSIEAGVFDGWKMRLRLTFGTAMIIIALVVGIFLGKWVSGKPGISETEIMLSYSSMLSNQGVGEFWENIVSESNGGQQ